MDRRINITYHSTDELLDMLRQEVEYVHHDRGQIVRALEELTGAEYDDDRLVYEDEEETEETMD